MKPVRIIDMVGKPVNGICIDGRTVTPDGEFRYEHTKDTPRPRTLHSVTLERKKDGQWLYWRFHESEFGCNYSGVRVNDNDGVNQYCLMMPDDWDTCPTVQALRHPWIRGQCASGSSMLAVQSEPEDRMKWIKLSNRYLNLAHVACVYVHTDGECDVHMANDREMSFSLKGADAEALLIALEEECK